MSERNDASMATIGTVQLGMTAVILLLAFLGVRTLDVADGHQMTNAATVEAKLDAQTQLLREVKDEVRRLQDERRTVDELKEALRGAQPQYLPMPMMPQQLYGPPQQGAAPQPTQPQQPQQPEAPPQQPRTGGEGEGVANAQDLGTDKRMPGPDPKAVIGGTFVEATAEPHTLNVYATTEGATRTVMINVLEKMFEVSEQDPTKLDAMLAESWEASPDKLTYTYRLRKDVTWSDGAPFTADDVLFTYAVIQDPRVKADAHRASYVDVESVTKLDVYTVQAKFKTPYWRSLYVFGSMTIIPKHWYEKKVVEVARERNLPKIASVPGEDGFGQAFNEIRGPCVGTGPYVVTNWTAGESITMKRNPTYWRLKVVPNIWNIETRKIRFISDTLAKLNQVRQQKIDVQVVDLDEWQDGLSKEKVITDNYNFYAYDHLGLAYNFVLWNCRKFPFNDKRVRQAMTHLIDRAGMLRDLWRNDGDIATCANKKIYPEYNHSLVPHPFDPNKAGALLKEAGFVDNDGDGILEKQVDGEWKRLEFTFKVPGGRAEFERIGNKMQEAMARVGVKMEIKVIEWSVFYQHFQERNFDAVCLYNSFTDPWIDNYGEWHSSQDVPFGDNASGFHTPEIDKLLEDIRKEFDRSKRIPMYHKLYAIMHEELPMTLLIHGRVQVIAHKRFKNVIVRHKGMRSTYWWVDPSWGKS